MNILSIASPVSALSFARRTSLLASFALGSVQIVTAAPAPTDDNLAAESVAAYHRNLNDLRTYFAEATTLRETIRAAAEGERSASRREGIFPSAATASLAEDHHAELVRLREIDAAIARTTRDIQKQLSKVHFLDLEEAELLRARRILRDARGTLQEAAARQVVEDARQTITVRRQEVAFLVDELIRDVREQASEDLRKGD
ncbi:MAG: hypothetical protein JJT96_19250 [Opitutales bacterium]|nr:hypothetical protein [Opitutales bacterium]